MVRAKRAMKRVKRGAMVGGPFLDVRVVTEISNARQRNRSLDDREVNPMLPREPVPSRTPFLIDFGASAPTSA